MTIQKKTSLINDNGEICSESITKKTHRRKASYPLRVVDVTKPRKSTSQQPGCSQKPYSSVLSKENDSSQSSLRYSTDERDNNTDDGQMEPNNIKNDINVNSADQLKVFTWILQVFISYIFKKYFMSIAVYSIFAICEKFF